MFGREPSLSQLLRRLGLEKYAEVFHKNEIDMQLFLTMTDKELKEVGNNFWHSQKVHCWIQKAVMFLIVSLRQG